MSLTDRLERSPEVALIAGVVMSSTRSHAATDPDDGHVVAPHVVSTFVLFLYPPSIKFFVVEITAVPTLYVV